MNSELLPYYERELIFLRKVASEFAAEYPERASALQITNSGSDDPHVERILEGFALIAGRIQHKLDEEFPEITQSLLELLYPHLLRPIPPMAIMQFEADPELSKRSNGQSIPRGTMLYSRPLDGIRGRFRTTYDSTLWPIEVSAAEFGETSNLSPTIGSESTRYALCIRVRALGSVKISSLKIPQLRFRIGGDIQAAHWIYELLFTRVSRIVLRSQTKGAPEQGHPGNISATLPAASIRAVGFERNEALLPVAETSFQGYRLLQEYFCYPQKFLFFDLTGLDSISTESIQDELEILILIDGIEQRDRVLLLESSVNVETFQLGCTPAINLFEHSGDPIRLTHTKTEYEVIPDVHTPAGMEVHSVNTVNAYAFGSERGREFRPFYAFQHGTEEDSSGSPEAFWFSTRRASKRKGDSGSDVFLSLVDLAFSPSTPASESITVHTTCTNRDLLARLRFTGAWGEFDLEGEAAVRSRGVHGPTETIRPALRGELQWRLISHLSLNHLSLVEGGSNALQEILRLYDPASTKASARQIEGITSIKSTRRIARLDSDDGVAFCPGTTIDMEMDEAKFSGGSAFLLASILDRFFALYCSINSFTHLRVSTRGRRGVVWQWPIRSGEQAVV